MRRKLHIEEKMPRLVAELHAQFAESTRLEQVIKANLPTRLSVQCEAGRVLSYGR